MKLNFILLFLMILVLASSSVGCGKKGPPVPPLSIDKPENSIEQSAGLYKQGRKEFLKTIPTY
jgi:predicted small lipoprotein YifL